jgi:hypothetical protein
MHLQIRAIPARSPADLMAFLEVLAQARINIESVGGSNVEQGGDFAFSVADGQEDEAIRVLEGAGYQPRRFENGVLNEDGAALTTCWVTDAPGELLACVAAVTEANKAAGRVIRDLSMGKPGHDGLIPVQIYSEVFRGRRT